MNHHQDGNAPLPVVLTISGFDPSAGAGMVADLKTFAAHNCYGIAAITAMTVQNTTGVKVVEAVPAKMLAETLRALTEDITPAAIKIGMLGSAENVRAVVAILEKMAGIPVVLDPVLQSTSGTVLLDEKGVKELRTHLMKHVSVVTPNLDEASRLVGFPVTNDEEMKRAATELVAAGAPAAIITGGHLERPLDVLFDGAEHTILPGERIKNGHTHGTGCAFSSAIAANLALGRNLHDSAVLAKAYVAKAIEKGFSVGSGQGSPNHLFRLQQTLPPRAGGAEPHHMSEGQGHR
jgi:hydroxymethylpyrimidine kinase/phosphomethylpyrimidine kinase